VSPWKTARSTRTPPRLCCHRRPRCPRSRSSPPTSQGSVACSTPLVALAPQPHRPPPWRRPQCTPRRRRTAPKSTAKSRGAIFQRAGRAPTMAAAVVTVTIAAPPVRDLEAPSTVQTARPSRRTCPRALSGSFPLAATAFAPPAPVSAQSLLRRRRALARGLLRTVDAFLVREMCSPLVPDFVPPAALLRTPQRAALHLPPPTPRARTCTPPPRSSARPRRPAAAAAKMAAATTTTWLLLKEMPAKSTPS